MVITKLHKNILFNLLFKECISRIVNKDSPEYAIAVNELITLGLVRKSEIRNSKRGMLVATIGRKAYYNL